MKVPSEFTLGAVDWKVKSVECLGDRTGQTDSEKALILLEKNPNKQRFSQVFCHELIHAFLFSTGRMEHDETLVDGLSHFLHQYLEQIYEE